MNKIYYLIIPAIILFLFGCSSTDNQSTYPDADAVYNYLVEEYTLNEDGSLIYSQSKSIELMTFRAFHSYYGQTKILYNPDIQELAITKAVSINDGEELPAPDNAYNEVLPGFASKSAQYNHVREMVIAHTGLQPGTCIECDYTLTTKAQAVDFLNAKIKIQKNAPVKEYIIRVNIPKDENLKYYSSNPTYSPDIISKKGFYTYEWKIKNIPAECNEPYHKSDNPVIRFSTESKLNDKLVDYSCNEPDEIPAEIMEAMLHETKGLAGLEKAYKISDFFKNRINIKHIPGTLYNNKARSVTETLKEASGNLHDFSMLVCTALKASGLNAEMAYLINSNDFSSDMLCEDYFSNPLIELNLENEFFYFKADRKFDNIFDLVSEQEFILRKDGSQTKAGKHEYTSVCETNINLENIKKPTGSGLLQLSGAENPYYSLLTNPGYAKNICSSKTYNIEELGKEKTRITFSRDIRNLVNQKENYYFIDLPKAKFGYHQWGFSVLNTNRLSDIQLPGSLNEKYTYNLSLTDNMQVVNQTERSISNDVGRVEIKVVQNGNELIINKSLILNNSLVPKEKYEDFKSLINTYNLEKYRKIVLKNKN